MELREMNIALVNAEGTLDDIIKKYGIKTVGEFMVLAQLLKEKNCSSPEVNDTLKRIMSLPDEISYGSVSELKINIEKLTPVDRLPLNFKLVSFNGIRYRFKSVYELLNRYRRPIGLGEVKMQYLAGALKMYDERLNEIISNTPVEEWNLGLFNKDREEKISLVSEHSDELLPRLFEGNENFVWGPLSKTVKEQMLNEPRICSYIADYNNLADIENNDPKILNKFRR
ncbi:MAG: hypothetical protein ACI4OG_00065 [Bacilli bacterium]